MLSQGWKVPDFLLWPNASACHSAPPPSRPAADTQPQRAPSSFTCCTVPPALRHPNLQHPISFGSSPSCCRKRVGVTGTMTRQRHRRTWVHLFLQKAPNHSYWKTIDKKTLGPTKNDILCPKTKKKPQQDGRRGAMMINSNPVHQFSSVAQSCSIHCNPMNCSMPGLPVHHKLPEFIQIYVHQVSDAIQPSHPLLFPSPPAPNPSQHQGLFQRVNSSHQVASASALPMNTQDWSLLGWTGWISLQSKGLSRVFSNATVQKHQFFSAQLSLQPNSLIHTWPLEKQ